MNRAKVKLAYQKLDKEIDRITDLGLEDIAEILAKDSFISSKENIVSIVYSSLERTYSAIVSSLKDIYSHLKDFDVQDIKSLTYQDDGKTIEDRVESYLKEARGMVSTLYDFDLLLKNESRIIKRAIIKNRVKPIASILVIECEEEDCHFGCDHYAGEYPADEPIELPPYHPNCNCTYYFIETDDENDIKDLDLEAE